LKVESDVVIVGEGCHGFSLAYDLAKRGLENVLVLEKGYIGSGASGRNIELIRAMFSSPEWISQMKESIRQFGGLSSELNFNIMYAERLHAS
jgi:sarcosine oxidase subunit beta